MNNSDIIAKAMKETDKKACMIDMTIKTLDPDAPYSLDWDIKLCKNIRYCIYIVWLWRKNGD